MAESNQLNPRGLSILKYPLDLGTYYRHYLQILILKQGKSNFSQATLTRGGYNWGSDQEPSAAGGTGKVTNLGTQVSATSVGEVVAVDNAKAVFNSTAVDVAKVGVTGGTAAATVGNLNTSRKASTPVAYIQLYMPDTMQIDLQHDFDRLSVTDALGAAGTFESAGNGTGESQGALAAASGALGDAGAVKDLYVMSNGFAMNPQMEILYKGPKNRQFRYQFKFTPRNDKEAVVVENLITTLRFHACPEYSSGQSSRYFIPPSEFRINHMLDSGYNYSLPRIGQCVLEEVNVNYAAAGHYSTFKDGRPVEIQMDLTFTEVNILTKADIEQGF